MCVERASLFDSAEKALEGVGGVDGVLARLDAARQEREVLLARALRAEERVTALSAAETQRDSTSADERVAAMQARATSAEEKLERVLRRAALVRWCSRVCLCVIDIYVCMYVCVWIGE